MSNEEVIDLGKLTVKQLVIVLHGKMSTVEKRLDKKDEQDLKLLVDFTVVKTKVFLFGMLGGGAVTIGSYLIDKLLP